MFVLVFIAAALLFGQVSREMIIYLILTGAAMITGFLDDCAKTPWGNIKGFSGFADRSYGGGHFPEFQFQ